ncbi:complex I NDUFA9 subunit family protein [Sphingomonas donggukensis]|uniref:Complex I NDUFA9 subunit family protein n=1 Tax=Sphingomonas donggukensis TaxID=2949093 RepID=A0ABY4TT71_9SPHN|nr:complex I NDUFA9 subunit family protein [Sphingomonas donggukensis]URW75596.1 complex I NDUFA9 subunit family protein [Sphingomonas donggukensis]
MGVGEGSIFFVGRCVRVVRNKLVVLFGGGGFVGRYVAQALLAAGARVRVAQRDPRAAVFLKPLGGLGQTQFVAVDVRKPETVARALAGADMAVNLVGAFANMDALHVDGARHIAEAARDSGVQALVHVSAIGADPESASAYGRTKGEGEAAVRAAFPDATILRPSLVFGREDAFTNRFASMIAKAPMVPVLRAGTRFQPVYVKDVADAVVRALEAPAVAAGRVLELGGPDVLTMRAIQDYLAHEVGRSPAMLELPDGVGAMIASMGFLPGAPITSDQWTMLQRDNVVASAEDGFAALGIVPTAMASVAGAWLVRYRRHGRFAKRATA